MTTTLDRGLTPPALARLLHVSPDKVRTWILRGELAAVNAATSCCGRRPRYVILPDAVAAFLRERSAARPTPPPRRKKCRPGFVDFFPD